MKKKIVLIPSYSFAIINLRLQLIKDLVSEGYEVTCLCPKDNHYEEVKRCLKQIKVNLVPYYIINTDLSLLKSLRTIWDIFRRLIEIRPSHIFFFNIKPILLGWIYSAIWKKTKTYSMVTGLGHFFMDENINKRSSRLVQLLYKIALKANKKVFFQNQDDIDMFIKKKLISKKKAVLINGSGVDTKHFNYCGPSIDPLRFIFVGRLIKQKGVMEFYQAAKEVKRKHPNVIFTIVGGLYPNPSVLNEQEFKQITEDPDIEYLGELKDVRKILRKTSVFVLPSYREGTSRAILEAMSMGLPIITTDVPGCRQLVRNGENGWVVKPKNINDLVRCINEAINHTNLLEKIGQENRQKMMHSYCINKVNKNIIYYLERK